MLSYIALNFLFSWIHCFPHFLNDFFPVLLLIYHALIFIPAGPVFPSSVRSLLPPFSSFPNTIHIQHSLIGVHTGLMGDKCVYKSTHRWERFTEANTDVSVYTANALSVSVCRSLYKSWYYIHSSVPYWFIVWIK